MRLGIFSVVDHYPREMDRSLVRLYDELLEQAVAADELGFDSFWIAEHHFHEYGAVPRPPIWMSAAAKLTKRIRLGSAVVVLPFDNPLRTAEDYAMVDVLSRGRLNLGVGSGYLKHEYEGFGIPQEEKRERFDEALEILMEAWKGEPFSFHGRHHRVEDVALNIVPCQKPHPPVHIAVLRNEAAEFVGRRGFPIMMIPYATTEQVDELSEVTASFRKAFIAGGGNPSSATVTFGLHTFCGDTTESARRLVREAMNRYVRTRLYARQRSFEELIERDLIAAGDADEIVRVALRYKDAGLTDFLAITNFGGLEHEAVLESMERLAKRVMPRLTANLQSKVQSNAYL